MPRWLRCERSEPRNPPVDADRTRDRYVLAPALRRMAVLQHAGCPGESCRVRATGLPVPFLVYDRGVYLHGTKADLAIGEMLVPGRESNFEVGRVMNHVYFTATLDAAVWGAELAVGEGRERIYIVEPTGDFEDDPNVTDKKFPGNPTQSFRTREPLRVVSELVGWVGHSPENLQAMRDRLDALQRQGAAPIED